MHPPIGKEFEYAPGRYLTVLTQSNQWTVWKRQSSYGIECVAAKPADGLPPLGFAADGWVRGGLKIYLWLEDEGERWDVRDSTDAPLITSEWRASGDRFTQPFPAGRLFPNEGQSLRAIIGPSPFFDGQQIEVTVLSKLGRRATGKFSFLGLDATREALRHCRNSSS